MRKEAELPDASRAAEIRERAIAILGHDLRNPVAAIQAGTTLLGRMKLGDRADGIIDRMLQSTYRIAGPVDDLLDFARGRLGSGLTLVRKPTTQLAGAVEQVIAELRMVHPDREINVDLQLTDPVDCDTDRIKQLLSNLLANALTHGATGKPVDVSAESVGGEFTLTVANSGLPIPDVAVEALFQPFVHTSRNNGLEGLGLGLFIVSEIAKAHGGAIHVESNAEMTSFKLTMPSDPPVG